MMVNERMDKKAYFHGKNVLVAGGTGFVGREFVEQLLRAGASVRVTRHRRPGPWQAGEVEYADGDLVDEQFCRQACRGADIVIHAAGAVSAAGVTVGAGPMAPITTNLILTSRLLQAAWEEKVGQFLLFSSSTGYPVAEHAVAEDEFWDGPTHPSYFGYGWMRRYFERMGEFVHQRSDTKVTIVRPTATYGRHDDFDPRTSHVIPALIRRAVAKENPFVVWGKADVVRDFLHISDLIRGSLLALEHLPNCEPVNIGSGRPITIGEIVEATLAAAGHDDAEVVYDESKPTTIPFRLADTAKAAGRIGFEPVLDLAAGLKDTVEWYRTEIVHHETAGEGP
jgi:GDP-L-fucose synthase